MARWNTAALPLKIDLVKIDFREIGSKFGTNSLKPLKLERHV
ncbi:hypothetical protein [Pontibacter akesuensis]|nr:hypothetical protein [Pontibacter akesuensis]